MVLRMWSGWSGEVATEERGKRKEERGKRKEERGKLENALLTGS
jgi:hypothetical protein